MYATISKSNSFILNESKSPALLILSLLICPNKILFLGVSNAIKKYVVDFHRGDGIVAADTTWYTFILNNETEKIEMASSRRVEIKFRLKEDEMIEKIAQIIARE